MPSWQSILNGEDRDQFAKIRARAVLVARCSSLPGEETQLMALRTELLVSDPRAEQDPILMRTRAFREGVSKYYAGRLGNDEMHAAQHLAALAAAVAETGDPLLVLETVPLDFGPGKGYFFDGRFHDSERAGRIATEFDLARWLAACRLGADCGANDFQTLYQCAANGACAESRSAVVGVLGKRQGFSDDELRAVVDLSDRLAQAIASNRLEAFLPPISATR
jgi:hypothetical protein